MQSRPDNTYDVFMSYHWRDHPAVETLALALSEAGLRVFLDRWYVHAGRPWPQQLEGVLASCQAVTVCLGPGEMGPWQQREVNLALERQAREMAFPVIPVLLPGADPVLGFLGQNTWVDLRDRSDDSVSISILANAIRGNAPGPDAQAYVQRTVGAICPYRGLLCFREEDTAFFFGRDAAVDQLTTMVGRSSFVTVVGASGCGKSSVVRAGLLPALRRNRECIWEITTIVPGDRPMHTLAAALLPLLEPDMTEADRLIESNKLARGLEAGDLKLRDIVKRALEKQSGTDRLLIVVDQWEELYTLTSDETVRRRFIDELLDASARTPLSVVLTLRGDFVGHALAYRPLSDRMQGAEVNLGPMSRTELVLAIKKPAEKIGLYFESGLVERILDDAGQEPGNLPLLEFVLKQLWDSRSRGELLHAAYEDMGGIQGAVANKADQIYTKLTLPEQQAVRRIFLELATPAEHGDYTRRRASFAEIGPASMPVLERLTEERLLVTSPASGHNGGSVELAHEALIHNWDKFKVWLDQDREFLLWRKRFTALLDVWHGAGRHEDRLLAGALLVEAEKWASERGDSLSAEERGYVAASVTYRKREQARARRRLRAFVAVIVGLGVVALLFAINSQRERRRSNAEADHSLALQLAAQSGEMTNVRLADALLLGVAAVSHQPIDETKDNLFRLLRAAPVGLMGFQWGHTQAVLTVSFSPDGRSLATGDADGNVFLWNVANRKALGGPLRGHTGAVWSVAFSPDGKMLATGSEDKSVILWDVESRKPVGTPLKGDMAGIRSVVFAPDGRTLVTIDDAETAIHWDVASHQLLAHLLERSMEEVWKIAFTPDGRGLAIGSRELEVVVWDMMGRRPMGLPLEGYSGPPWLVAFSPDGKTLATRESGNIVKLWDAARGKQLGEPLEGGRAEVSTIAFSPDSNTLAAGSPDGTVLLWSVASRKPIVETLKGHVGYVNSIAFSPDGNTLATGSDDHTVMLWDLPRLKHSREPMHGETGQVSGVAFSPDGKTLAAVGTEAVLLWDVASRQQLLDMPIPASGGLATVAFLGNGKTLAIGGALGAVTLWDVASRKPLDGPIVAYPHSVRNYAISADEKTLAAAGFDGPVSLWDIAARKPLGELPKAHTGQVHSLAFSHDGKMLATGGEDHSVILWDVATRKPLGNPMTGHTGAVWSVAFSPDGKILATGSSNDAVILWDTSTRKPVGEPLKANNGAIMSLAINPEGTVLAMGGSEGTVIAWDIASRKGLGEPLRGHSAEVSSLDFSPDGKTLVSGSWDGSVRLWDITLDAESMMARACGMVNRNFTEIEWGQYMGKRRYRKICTMLPGPVDPDWPFGPVANINSK